MSVSIATRTCKCGGTEFRREFNTASGDLACVQCGVVLEENPIVSEVTFAETSTGAATVQGAFVGSDQSRASFGGNRGSLDSREQTLANGKRRIKNVAAALRIPDFISDAAYNLFQLALLNNFVQGRRSQNVVASCLYIACRKEKTHHMLIDFSSRLQVSVYAVGATFLKMVKALHIRDLPLVDPSLFIQHFADKLDFGTVKLKVIQDAVKLSHRMSEDWIHEGRRPAGIAGACILLAARMNNFRRTHSEIVAVSHVSEFTIQKRLNEFKNTHASKLTVSRFRENSNVERTLPPAFTTNRKRERKIIDQIIELEETGEEAIKKDPILITILSDTKFSEDEIDEYIRNILSRQKKDKKRRLNSLALKNGEKTLISDSDAKKDKNSSDDDDNDEKENNNQDDDVDEEEDDVEKAERLKAKKLREKRILEMEEMIEINRPKNLTKLGTTEDLLAKISDEAENLDDVDDYEVDSILLTEEESNMKERVWTGSNQDYLLAMEAKRLKEEADRIAGHNQPTRKKRKARQQKEDYSQYMGTDASKMGLMPTLNGIAPFEIKTAADSAKVMLQRKSLSKKINYAAVNDLFEDS
ncbi:hypothetical protein BVG19_g1006 [[Candida] boidinii]|nr:hypothetical protein BVG19_g1006 [[Candida] boidinii]OWB50615.1 DNA binding protein [[Candida] boidinii]